MMLAMPTFAAPLLDEVMHDIMHPRFASMHNVPRLIDDDEAQVYTVTLAAAGVRAKDVNVSADGNRLSIEGETNGLGSVRWATSLPRDADADAATATTTDGIITVVIPKKALSAPVSIMVHPSVEEAEAESGDGESSYKFTLAAPGLAASDVEVMAKSDEGTLTINGETKRTGARVAKSVRMPRDADVASASAVHVDGILTVVVPKKEEAKRRLIVATAKAADETAADETQTADEAT